MKCISKLLIMATLMSLLLTGCGATTNETDKKEIIVFAAASMTETLQKIAAEYEEEHKNIKLTFNFDSSGTLKTQIEEGATCDVFISASPKQVNQLEESGFLYEGTRRDLLENKVVLIVPKKEKSIQNFDDWANQLKSGVLTLAMGNSDVPVGAYTQKILKYYGIDENDLIRLGNVTYGSNVKEVTTQLQENLVDSGIIYCTDAFSAGLDILDYASPEMCGQVIYPGAVIKETKAYDEALSFLNYLKAEKSQKIFKEVGFTVLP